MFGATPPACGGTVTQTWTATDPCGRVIATVSRTITVTPAALPTMTAPADTTVNCGGIPSATTLTYSNGLSGSCLITGQSNASTFGATPPACGGILLKIRTPPKSCLLLITTLFRSITVTPAALPTMTAPADTTVNCGGIPSATTLTYSNGLSGSCLITGQSNASDRKTTRLNSSHTVISNAAVSFPNRQVIAT